MASFRFTWAITETCCSLLDIPLAFLPPGFLMTLQMSSTFLSVRTWSLSGQSSPCSLTSSLAALGLNPSHTYISCSQEAIISGPHGLCTHRIPLAEGLSFGHFHFCIFCIRIYPPLLLSIWLNFRFWPLIVYIQIIVWYVFALCGICLSLLLRVSFRLLCTFLLWPGCQASLHWPSHLGSGQTTMSTTDMSCYCYYNNCSSGRELQCQLMIMVLLPQLICVEESLALTQCDDFVSIVGQLVASLNERLLVCLNSHSMLCGHQNSVFMTCEAMAWYKQDPLPFTFIGLKKYLQRKYNAIGDFLFLHWTNHL